MIAIDIQALIDKLEKISGNSSAESRAAVAKAFGDAQTIKDKNKIIKLGEAYGLPSL